MLEYRVEARIRAFACKTGFLKYGTIIEAVQDGFEDGTQPFDFLRFM